MYFNKHGQCENQVNMGQNVTLFQDLLHYENDSKPFLLLKFESCTPSKKIRKSLKKVKRRIERNQMSSHFLENNYLFPPPARQKRDNSPQLAKVLWILIS